MELQRTGSDSSISATGTERNLLPSFLHKVRPQTAKFARFRHACRQVDRRFGQARRDQIHDGDQETEAGTQAAWLRGLMGLAKHCDKRSSVGSVSSQNTFTAPPI